MQEAKTRNVEVAEINPTSSNASVFIYLFIYLFIYCILFFLEWHKFYEALIFLKKLPE